MHALDEIVEADEAALALDRGHARECGVAHVMQQVHARFAARARGDAKRSQKPVDRDEQRRCGPRRAREFLVDLAVDA